MISARSWAPLLFFQVQSVSSSFSGMISAKSWAPLLFFQVQSVSSSFSEMGIETDSDIDYGRIFGPFPDVGQISKSFFIGLLTTDEHEDNCNVKVTLTVMGINFILVETPENHSQTELRRALC